MVERTRVINLQITEICTAPSAEQLPTDEEAICSIKDRLHADNVEVKSIKNFDVDK